jgi:hypothetical protein
LKPLQRGHLIDFWDDRDITAGSEWEREISEHLNTAQIILLLISPDFLASDYCYGTEMQRAMERHESGEAHVIPIILRPVFWQTSPFGKLQALPINAKPVVSPTWNNWDEAFFDIAEGIRKVVEQRDFSTSLNLQNLRVQNLTDQERLNRAAILTRLRRLYVLSHDNISPGIMAGTEPLPKEWVEEELDKMGENWRQENYYVNLDDDLNSDTLVTKTTSSMGNSQVEIITAKLREFILLWTLIYGKNSEKLINPFLSDLQTKLILMSDQLVRMLSWNSREIPKEILSDIGSIAAKLENLGRMQFFLDGGLSASKFNDLGDDLVNAVERVIEQLNSVIK